jgi:hypothetical protein
MSTAVIQFELRTPERTVTTIEGHLRDAVIAIHRSLNMFNPVVSAYVSKELSISSLTGYMDGAGQVLIYRYLTFGSGAEFENWLDAHQHARGLLPDEAWEITRFVHAPPPSGVLGEAILKVEPGSLPAIDFSRESGARRKHYASFTIDAFPVAPPGTAGWTASYVLKATDGRTLGPMKIHSYYESKDRAVDTAISHAESFIDSYKAQAGSGAAI